MEHLETDVMRFMAILAFCLVAIFALVQSVPAPAPAEKVTKRTKPVPDTVVTDTVATTGVTAPAVPRPEPEPPPAAEARVPAPTPRPQPVAEVDPPEPAVEPEPTPQPAPETIPETIPETTPPEPEPAQPPETRRGFSLRFDSDGALVGLVERDEVALYAFARDRIWRFMLVDGRPAFRSAAAPGEVHEMTPETVPTPVLDALRRSVVVPAGGVRWGVTLPPATAAVLGRVIATNEGGELVIDADGFLRLEDTS